MIFIWVGVAGSVRKSTEVAQALQVAGTAAKLAVQRVAAQDEAGGKLTIFLVLALTLALAPNITNA